VNSPCVRAYLLPLGAPPAAPCIRHTLCPRTAGARQRSPLRFDLARHLDAWRICKSMGLFLQFFVHPHPRGRGADVPDDGLAALGDVDILDRGTTTAHVRIDLGRGAVVTASITNEGFDDLKLARGQKVQRCRRSHRGPDRVEERIRRVERDFRVRTPGTESGAALRDGQCAASRLAVRAPDKGIPVAAQCG